MTQMINSKFKLEKSDDLIFMTASRAKKAIEKYGKDNVIDSTLGTLFDENEKFVALDTVYDTLKYMDKDLIASYAPISGTNEFIQSVIKICFEEHKPDAYISASATIGGTGAIRNIILTYTDEDDYVICPNWYWPPYKPITTENNRNFLTYELLDTNYKFNIEEFEKALDKSLENRQRVVAIFNTPANNPTGFSIDDDSWDKILEIIKEKAKDDTNKITILIDAAYIEFAGNGEQKKFLEKFSNLKENILVTIAYSMSKSFTAYGLRTGASIAISSSKEVIEEFEYSQNTLNRCTWSNGVHSAMNVLVELTNNKETNKAYRKEIQEYRELLRKRAKIFEEISKEIGLNILPYFGGFFITVLCKNPKEVAKKLEDKNLFIIPNERGLRFAVCAVKLAKCKKAPYLIKETIDQING